MTKYSDAVTRLAKAQKPGHGVPAYTRYVNRPMGRRLAAAAFVLNATPNQVTAASMCSSYLGMILLCLIPPTPAIGLVVGLLMVLGYALDSADGQLARLQGAGGPAGEWVDHVSDMARQSSLHLAVLIFLFRYADLPPAALAVPMVFLVVTSTRFFSQILAEQMRRQGLGTITPESQDTGADRRAILQLPSDAGVMCLCFLLSGAPLVFFGAYAMLLVGNVALAGASLRRRYRELSGS